MTAPCPARLVSAEPPPPATVRPDVEVHPAAAGQGLWSRAFARLFLVQTAFGLSFSAFFLLPKFLTQRGASPAQVGVLMSMWGVSGVLVAPLLGRGLDRLGRRAFLRVGTGLMALSAFGFAFVHGYGWAAVGLRFLQGVAFAFVFNGALALVADRTPASRMGQALGLIGSATLLANAIATSVAERVAHAVGWSWAFALAGAMGLLALLVASGVREPTPPVASAATAADTTRLDRWFVLALVSGNLACGIGFGTLASFHEPYALSLGIERVSGFFVGYTSTALCVRWGLGRFIDRIGPRRTAIGSLVLYAVVTGAGSILGTLGLTTLGAALGIAHGVFYPSIAAFGMGRAGPRARGRVTALLHGSFSAGIAASASVLGLVAEKAGYPALFLTAAAFVAAGAVGFIGLGGGRARKAC